MKLEISDYEEVPALRAAAVFINALADINEARPKDSPFEGIRDSDPLEGAAPTIVEAVTVAETAAEPPPLVGALAVGDVELDAAGLPWDERICSSGHTKKANGMWVAKRGVDKAYLENVQAELLATMAVGLPTTPVVVAEVAADTQAAAVFGGQQAVPATNVVPIVDENPKVWPDVMQFIVGKSNAGTLDDNKLNAFLAANQVAAFPLLANRPDLYPALLEAVR